MSSSIGHSSLGIGHSGAAPAPVRALTLHQPHASAMALGLKRVETRGWSTAYRGPVVIHAALAKGERQKAGFGRMVAEDRAVFEAAGLYCLGQLPLGRPVALATLVDVLPVESFTSTAAYYTPAGDLLHRSPREERWGIYTPGRFAWIFDAVRPLATPYPSYVCGYQGLWHWRGVDLAPLCK